MNLPKLNKKDMIAIVITVVILILMAIPNYIPKGDCEVARAGYTCDTILNVMRENCNYLQNNSFSDQNIVWYVNNLCELQNKYHDFNLDCSNIQAVCNNG